MAPFLHDIRLFIFAYCCILGTFEIPSFYECIYSTCLKVHHFSKLIEYMILSEIVCHESKWNKQWAIYTQSKTLLCFLTFEQLPLQFNPLSLSITHFNQTYIQILRCFIQLLYTNIDLKLRNKKHGSMHCNIGVTCVYNDHVFYTLL